MKDISYRCLWQAWFSLLFFPRLIVVFDVCLMFVMFIYWHMKEFIYGSEP